MFSTAVTHMTKPLPMLLMLAGLMLSVVPLHAQSAAGDEAAIRQRLATYAEARTRRDAATEARCYTTDGDFRSSQGPFVSGREAIEKQLTVNDPSYTFGLTVTKLRMLTPQVAMVDADVAAGPAGRTAKLLGSYVMVRTGADWLIAAARISTMPPPRPAAAAPAAPTPPPQ
jgi:uncharacterized protein (TIGR02246 family)